MCFFLFLFFVERCVRGFWRQMLFCTLLASSQFFRYCDPVRQNRFQHLFGDSCSGVYQQFCAQRMGSDNLELFSAFLMYKNVLVCIFFSFSVLLLSQFSVSTNCASPMNQCKWSIFTDYFGISKIITSKKNEEQLPERSFRCDNFLNMRLYGLNCSVLRCLQKTWAWKMI